MFTVSRETFSEEIQNMSDGDIEDIQIDLLDAVIKHGKHNQASHGRRTARRRAYSAAYSSARAAGASPAEARATAREAGVARQAERDTRLERLRGRASQPIARERVESALSAGEGPAGQSFARALSRQVPLTERELNEVITIRDAYNRAFNNGSPGIVALPYASQMTGSGKSPIENLRDAARSTNSDVSWPAQQVLRELEK